MREYVTHEEVTLCSECDGTGAQSGWPYPKVEDPYRRQVGGTHYEKYEIQPMQYILANGLGFGEGSVVKYVTRWRDKGGVEDLRKSIQVLVMMIAEETSK